MKNKNLVLLVSIIAISMAIGYYVFSLISNLNAHSGVLLSFAMAAGISGEGMLGVDRAIEEAKEAGVTPIIDAEFEQTVIDMTPGIAPLDTMIRTIGRKRSTDVLNPAVFSIDSKPFSDISTASITGGDAVVSAFLKPGDQRLWNVGDTVLFENINGYDKDGNVTPLNPLWGYIYAVDAVNGYAIQPINGKMNASGTPTFFDNIPENNVIYRGSKPGTESQLRTIPGYAVPSDDFNYIHKFMAQIEVTEWEEKHKKTVKWGFAEQSERALKDYRATKEIQYFRGTRSLIHSSDPKETEPRRMCGGFTYFNPNFIDLSSKSAITDADYVGLTEQVFDGNSGSETRVMFCGSTFMTAIQNSQRFTKLLDAQKTEITGGVEMLSIMTNYGKLLIKHHPLFGLIGWKNAAAVIDFQNLKEVVFESFRRLPVDFTKIAEKQAKGLIVWESTCPEFTYPQAHSFIVGPGGL